MFGLNVKQIAEGHFKEITRLENLLFNQRIKICKQCPLYTNGPFGPVCNSLKCFNEQTQHVSTYPRSGYVCGCGCRLNAALRVADKKCVLNKW